MTNSGAMAGLACVGIPPGTAYTMVDHVCRHCAGRMLQAGDVFRCSSCAATTIGRPDEVCGCGMVRAWAKGRFMCGPNPARSPANPGEIAILFGGKPLQRKAPSV